MQSHEPTHDMRSSVVYDIPIEERPISNRHYCPGVYEYILTNLKMTRLRNYQLEKSSKKLARVYEVIFERFSRTTLSSTIREIRSTLGISSTSAVTHYLDQLIAIGIIKDTPFTARALRPIEFQWKTHPTKPFRPGNYLIRDDLKKTMNLIAWEEGRFYLRPGEEHMLVNVWLDA